MKMNRKKWLTSAAFLSIIILAGQLLAGVGFSADSVNSGPRIAIVQMGNDENSAWATRDIESRLEKFIQDDPFIKDRIAVYHVDTLEKMTNVDGDIIIYISHGGKNGLMTGDHMTTWEEMAKVVMDSDASIHLFAACKSKEIIKYGEEKSGKHLYTVPSVRAAEVTNVEIATIVMLADGVSTDVAEEYRNTELMKAKQLIESGKPTHPLPFDEIILAEIDTLEAGHNAIFEEASENPSDNDERFLEFYIDTSWDIDDYNLIPQRIRSLLEEYYPTGTVSSLSVTCRANYYTREVYEAELPAWMPDATETDVFTGCTYSGEFILDASPIDFTVRLTASGATENGVDSITLEHVNDGGVYVIQEKETGIWQSPIVGRNRTRTGGTWTDSGATVRFNQPWETPISEEWSYRKTHTIYGSQGAGANYQVRFVVHGDYGDDSGEHVYCNGNCRQDFADIRFRALDGKNLNHWIESIDYSTNQAVFWVKIEGNLDSDQQIYIYYGNEQASSESNGDATFLFFDDFENNNWNRWTSGGSWQIQTTTVKHGDRAAWGDSGSGASTCYYDFTQNGGALTHGVLVHYWWRVQSTGKSAYFRSTSDKGTDYDLVPGGAGSGKLSYYTGSTYNAWPSNPSYSANTWYELEHAFLPDTHKQQLWKSGGHCGELDWNIQDGPASAFNYYSWMPHGSYTGRDSWTDDIFIRKFVVNEPSHGAWGSEELLEMLNPEDWLCRKSHMISGQSGAGPNYQVRIVAHYGSGTDSGENVYLNAHCQLDFDDIRFTDGNGITKLDHWRGSYTSSDKATFWVEVADSLDSDQQIYIYYGNDQAVSESNGDATFLFFDDFENNNWNRWTSGGSWQIQTTTVKHGDRAAWGDSGSGASTCYYDFTQNGGALTHGVLVHYWWRVQSTGKSAYFRSTSDKGTDYDLVPGGAGSGKLSYYTGSTYNAWPSNPSYSANTWYELEHAFLPDTHKQQLWKSGGHCGELDWNIQDGPATAFNYYSWMPHGSYTGRDSWTDDIFIRKFLVNEPSHGAWGEEQSARLKSSGEYLYISSIPEGSGWHGPTFTKNLPTYFGFDQLDTFSAELSLVHDGDGSRMSKTSVNLYDQNDVCVMSLQVIDDTNAQSQKFRSVVNGRYIWGDNAAIHETDYISGNGTGTVSIRYDPLRGIIAKVFDLQETVLYSPNDFDPDISMKYITIESLRFDNEPEHDERISDINVNFAASDYAAFDFECNTMDGFHKDLDFGYGASSDGEFVVPYGADYMTPSSIPDSPAGWHGPNFVHVLDRPFRLYQLSEFSVIGQLIQSSSTMGKTYVALFDENKQIVLLIMWGDASVGSKTSYFNVYFYPQNGGSYYQASGYIYNSGFTKTGKLWWDDGFGAEGAIYSTIDGSGDAYPIGECDNASRVIKYVVLLGYRYSDENLVDMRIHDINVIVDLNRQGPAGAPEPEEYDGTDEGRFTQEDLDNTDFDLSDAMAHVSVYWTGPWPLLHYETNIPLAPEYVPEGHPAKEAEGTVLHAHIAKNLMGETESQEIHTLGDDSFGQPSDEILDQQVAAFGNLILDILLVALVSLEIAMHLANVPAIAAFILVIVLMSVTFFEMLRWFHHKMLAENKWTHYECAHNYFMWGLGILQLIFMPLVLIGAVNFIAPATPAATVFLSIAAELTPVQVIAQAMKLAIIFLFCMALNCFTRGFEHLLMSF